MISNILSANEIADIVNNPIVKSNKEKLSILQKVDFLIQISDEIKIKLENSLNINLSEITSIPMRWIRGDTPIHTDRGENHFSNTYLMYLTDSVGNLFIDGQSYPIAAGNAHIFSEGIEHYTINTGNEGRLMIGPLSETGFRVGVPTYMVYFNNETDAANATNGIDSYSYTVETVNDISSWVIYSNIDGTDPSPNGGPYTSGTDLIATGIYYLYPYIQPLPPQPRPARIRSLYTDNSLVFYKPHSLSTSGGGSGVKNSRHIQRRI
jgi:hypothetical protein